MRYNPSYIAIFSAAVAVTTVKVHKTPLMLQTGRAPATQPGLPPAAPGPTPAAAPAAPPEAAEGTGNTRSKRVSKRKRPAEAEHPEQGENCAPYVGTSHTGRKCTIVTRPVVAFAFVLWNKGSIERLW